jgi:hypothetical protein
LPFARTGGRAETAFNLGTVIDFTEHHSAERGVHAASPSELRMASDYSGRTATSCVEAA